MMNPCYIICYDLETSGLDCEKDEIVQIAAIIIDPQTLQIVEDSLFNSLVRPVSIFSGTDEEIEKNWWDHQGAWDVNKKTMEQLKKAPLPEHVWKKFVAYVKKYTCGGVKGKPILAGHNIVGFDNKWLEVLAERYKTPNLFNKTIILDTMYFGFLNFYGLPEPADYKLDSWRKFFGVSLDGAHDASNDATICSKILIKFLALNRRFAPKVSFKDCFIKNPI